jgi:hypothetical protein
MSVKMIRLRYLTLSVLVVLIAVSTVPLVSSDVLRGEFTVPNWVKNTAGWWASDQIPDSAFLQGIQYLIKEGIMIVETPTEIDSEAAEEVPGWVKNTAGWWAEDKIHDTTFVSGIKYLIGKGILVVMEPQVEEAKCNFKGKEVVCSLTEKEVVTTNDFYIEVNGGSCTYCLNWAYVGKEYNFQIETFDERNGKYIDGVKISAKIISKDGELRHSFGEITTEDGIYKNSITIPNMDWYAENILSVTGEYYGVEKTIQKEFEVFAGRASGSSQDEGTMQSKFLYPVNATSDGSAFSILSGAHSVDTFTIGSSTYAIVTAQSDDGVQIIDLSGLGRPSGAIPFSGILAKHVASDGADGFTKLNGARNVAAYTIHSATASELSLTSTNYAIVAGLADNGLQVIDIGNPADIAATDAETDDENKFDELVGAYGIATFTISSNGTYRGAIVTANTAGSVMSVDITNPKAIFEKDVETDDNNSFDELDGPRGVDTWTVGGKTYAIVVSQSDDGVQIIDISNPAAIVATDNEEDGVNGFTELDGAHGVAVWNATSTTVTSGEGSSGEPFTSTYAIVASVQDNGVQIIDLTDPAAILALDAETDNANGFTELGGAAGVDTFTCGKRTYAIVSANTDDGIQLIDITNPLNIVAVTSQSDETTVDGVVYNRDFTELDGARSVNMFTVGGVEYAIVTAQADNGIQIVEPSCKRH